MRVRILNLVPGVALAVLCSGVFAQVLPASEKPAAGTPEPTVETASEPGPASEKPMSSANMLGQPVPAPGAFPVPGGTGLPPSLDEMVELAQRTSPEVMIAEAQLREAEARLREARLQATQRAIQSSWDRKAVEAARQNVRAAEEKYRQGVTTHQEVEAAQQRLTQLESAVASYDAAMQMMANSPESEPGPGRFSPPRVSVARPEIPKDNKTQIQQTLEAPISIEFEQQKLSAVAVNIGEQLGVNIVLDVGLPAAEQPVTVRVSDTSLRDALLALADACPNLCFVIRDYGIFATTPERAMTINAPTIPSDIPLYLPMGSQAMRGVAAGGFGFGGFPGVAAGGGGGAFPGAPGEARLGHPHK